MTSGRKRAQIGLKTLTLAFTVVFFLVGDVSQSLTGVTAASNGLQRLRSAPLQAPAYDLADDDTAQEPNNLAALETDADVAMTGDEEETAAGSNNSPFAQIKTEQAEPSAMLTPQDIAEAKSGVSAVNKAFKRAEQLTEGALGSLETVKRETEQLGTDVAELKKADAEVRQVAQVQDASEKAVEALKQSERAALAKQAEETTASNGGDAVQSKTEPVPPATNAVGALFGSQGAFWTLSLTFLLLSMSGSTAKIIVVY